MKVCVSSDHSSIQFNLANEKTSQYFVFLYAPNIENWYVFFYFQPKTKDIINKETKTK